MPDVFHKLSPQLGHRLEHPARDDVALDLGKPEFDLVEPGGIGRSEVQVNLRMAIQKVVDLSRLMGREVVGNHVDLFAARLVDDDVGQERDELRGCMPHGGLAEYLAGLGVERCVQRQRAVPEVLKAVSFSASRREWQHRILAIERWIDVFSSTQNTAACAGGFEIQPNDVGGLLLKVRVVGCHVAVEPLGLESVLGPRPCHHHVTDLELRSQPASAPLSRPVRRRMLSVHCKIRASRAGVSVVASCPACLLNNPASRSSRKRLLQRLINASLQSSLSRIAAQVWPASSSNISRARRASSARPLRLAARWLSSRRRIRQYDGVSMNLSSPFQLLQYTSTHLAGWPG